MIGRESVASSTSFKASNASDTFGRQSIELPEGCLEEIGGGEIGGGERVVIAVTVP